MRAACLPLPLDASQQHHSGAACSATAPSRPALHIKEGNLAAHVAMPSVPSPNEIVVAQQTVKNEENARSHTRSIPCLKAISRRPNCCILRPVCHQHRGAEDLATIAPQGASSASPPLTGFPGSERLPCVYYVSSRRSFVQEKGVIPIKISHYSI